MEEIWKEIDGYPNYMVSNWGRVKSLGRWINNGKNKGKRWQEEKIRNLSFNKRNGYLYVILFKEGNTKGYSVHRLVYETFVGEIPYGMQCNHINEKKDDNRLENLNLMTPKENVNWGTARERISEKNKGKHHTEETRKKISEKTKGRKYSEEAIRKRSEKRIGVLNTKRSKSVLQIDPITNEVIKEWPSAAEVQRQLGYFKSHISSCCLGRLKTHKGFIWKYENK